MIEACANAGWVHDRAVAAGHTVKVANTAAEAWKFQHLCYFTSPSPPNEVPGAAGYPCPTSNPATAAPADASNTITATKRIK